MDKESKIGAYPESPGRVGRYSEAKRAKIPLSTLSVSCLNDATSLRFQRHIRIAVMCRGVYLCLYIRLLEIQQIVNESENKRAWP